MTILETERLDLREMTVDDAENAYELNRDRDVIRYTGDEPFADVDSARAFLEQYKDYKLYGMGRWAVILKKTEEFLGWCGIKYCPDTDEYDIGFRLHKKYWGKGYATEAADACITLGFDILNIEELVGKVLKDNVASVRVLEKLGFEYDSSGVFHGEEGVVYKKRRDER